MSSVKVELKTKQGSFAMEKGTYQLDANGRLPLKQIMTDWNVKDLVWIEMEEQLEMCTDGYSEMAFGFAAGKTLALSGTVLQKNDDITKNAKPLPTKKDAPAPKIESSGEYKSRTEKAEEDRLLKNLNKGSAADRAKASEQAAAEKSAADAKREKDQKEKAEWMKKRDAEEAARKKKLEEEKKKQEDQKKKQEEEKKKLEEEKKKQEEAKKKAEIEAKKAADEKKKQEDEKKKKDDEKKKQELEAKKVAEEKKKQEELKKKQELEAKKVAEEKKKQEEQQKKQQEEKKKQEEAKKAEEAKKQKEAEELKKKQEKEKEQKAKEEAEKKKKAEEAAAKKKVTRPANEYASSATATAVYNGANVLFDASTAKPAGDVSAVAGDVLDAAEGLEMEHFTESFGKLCQSVASSKSEKAIEIARSAVHVAQTVAVNGEIACEDPDNETAVEKYTAATDQLSATLTSLKAALK